MWWFRVSAAVSLAAYAYALTIPDWGLRLARFAPVYAILIVAYLAGVWGVWRWDRRRRAPLRRPAPPGSEAPAPPLNPGDRPAERPAPAATRHVLLFIWLAAVLYRALAVAAPPTLSDDLYRYLWDGRVFLDGINPYRFAPVAPDVAHLRDALWPLINNPTLPTIYPPVLQVVFALVAFVSPTLAAWKIAAALFDLGAAWFLMRALAATGRSRLWILLYLWHPLPVIEFAGNGHSDVVGLFLVCMGFGAWATNRYFRSGVAITLAGLVKFLPWVALPMLWPRLRWKWFLLPVLAALAYLPFQVIAGFAPLRWGEVNALGSLGVFANTWRANDFLFGLLVREGVRYEEAVRDAKLIAAGIVAVVWLGVLFMRRPPPKLDPRDPQSPRVHPDLHWHVLRYPVATVFSWTVGVLLLLSPVVHPWYVLWLLPAAMLARHPAWWAWTLTVFLAYAPLPEFRATGVWTESAALKALEYLPVLLLLPLQTGWNRRSMLLYP